MQRKRGGGPSTAHVPEVLVGTRVGVLWPGDGTYYYGEVVGFREEDVSEAPELPGTPALPPPLTPGTTHHPWSHLPRPLEDQTLLCQAGSCSVVHGIWLGTSQGHGHQAQSLS